MSGQRAAQKWASDLLFNAIVGALGTLFIYLLGSWRLPEHWWPAQPGWWYMAGIGAAVGVLSHYFDFKKRRRSENSN